MRSFHLSVLCAGVALAGFSASARACDWHSLGCEPCGTIHSEGFAYTSGAQFLQGTTTFDVAIANFAFDPPTVIIERDMAVRWTNNDFATHTATSQAAPNTGLPDGRFDSQFLSHDATYEHTFDAVDLYDYFCDVHGISMQGTIDVRYPGDATGNGMVDFNDLLTVAQHYGTPSPVPATAYAYGDFTIDGTVDFNDLLVLAQHYGQSADVSAFSVGFQHDWASAQASIPEPMSLGLVGFGMIVMGRRRR